MSDEPYTYKQHFVPRFYLKHWVVDDNSNTIVRSRRLSSLVATPKSIECDLFYRISCYDNISFPYEYNHVEKELRKYESKHDRLLDRILKRCDSNLPVLDKGTNRLCDYLEMVGLMMYRNPYNPMIVKYGDRIATTDDIAKEMNNNSYKNFNVTGIQVAANALNQSLLFRMTEEFKQLNATVYFVKSPPNMSFITGDNPVMQFIQCFYFPLSPRYASFIDLNTKVNYSFIANRVNQIDKNTLEKFNKFFLRDEVQTLVGIDRTALNVI